MPDPPPSRSQFVIGLAGHIDHGKSALVQALTGGNVDRLPEERRRGITIELGFSHFDAEGCRFALIDVPGHERFIHTMVAGASGVDAALLVIAADDSVMPQTREHLALLDLLGVRRGVIAISKCDLADDEQLELVELEVADLLAASPLAAAPRLRVSAHAGVGIEELRRALIAAARSSPERPRNEERFRLPIDRAFSPAGQGAVVTGTVWRGTARVGDTLQVLPAKETVRIRRLQSQGKDVEIVSAGDRAALNLVGIKAGALGRGDELVTPDTLEPGRRHLVQLRLLADAGQPLKQRQAVRLHLAANQVTASVAMAEREVKPGETAFAVLRCSAPIVAEYGQPFVLRQLSPPATIGGGVFLAPALRPIDRVQASLAMAPGLASADPQLRLAAYIGLRRETMFDPARDAPVGLSPSECQQTVERLVARREVIRSSGSPAIYVTATRFRDLKQKLLRRCQIEIERRKPAVQAPVTAVLSTMGRDASPPVLEALLADMAARREIVRRGDRVGLPTGPALSQKQRQLLEKLLAEFAAAGRAPPTMGELSERHTIPLRDLEPLVQVAIDEGHLIRLSPQMAIQRDALEGLRQSLAAYFQRHPTAKVGELREQWGITRKHAVPIFEYFDADQITLRAGDLRSPGPRLSLPLGE